MNILILDDQEIIFTAPADYFVDPHDFRADNVVQVTHPMEFMNFMVNGTLDGPWDMVWLDHDLGTPDYSGRDISKWIAETAHANEGIYDDIEFWITTMNPHASKQMYMDIDHYTNAIVHRYDMSSLRDLGISRGGNLVDKHAVLRRPSGFLINEQVTQEIHLP